MTPITPTPVTPNPVERIGTSKPAPLRVLHLNAGNLYGGVETVLATLARFRHLAPELEQDFAVCYVGRSSKELSALGATVHVLGPVRISRPWTVWGAQARLRELLAQKHFDVVVCHMAWTLTVFGGTARRAGKGIVFYAHGYQTGKTWLEKMARRTVPDLIIANTRATGNTIATLFPRMEPRVMYYPATLVSAPDANQWRVAVRREQGVDDGTTVIVQVSRMEPWKGQILHLQALARIQATGRWVCWMVGGTQKPDEVEFLGELQTTAQKLGIAGKVRFLGERSDVPRLLAAADIFCQPNKTPEPFGIVFVEALWAGRPVVTTAMGGGMEIVNDSCGIVVEPANPSALALALGRLIDSPELRERLGQHGPERALELCDPATQLKAFTELSRGASKEHLQA